MSDGPEVVAKGFVDAIAWGEHHRVWELLSADGRRTVLRVGTSRGMDEALVARLGDGTAATSEREEFLSDLIKGLRADLAGNDLDTVEAELDTSSEGPPGTARVVLVSPLPAVLNLPGLPMATVDLVDEAGEWRVERIIALTSQP
ncbi:MAG: hypothetical protein KY447_03900 [Actinobacteria bacterium]|nr:hypothetical protein [Actinomycetota bacterium]MBW3642036.1 hypothetical protein [Actinomycetota bacterium]